MPQDLRNEKLKMEVIGALMTEFKLHIVKHSLKTGNKFVTNEDIIYCKKLEENKHFVSYYLFSSCDHRWR